MPFVSAEILCQTEAISGASDLSLDPFLVEVNDLTIKGGIVDFSVELVAREPTVNVNRVFFDVEIDGDNGEEYEFEYPNDEAMSLLEGQRYTFSDRQELFVPGLWKVRAAWDTGSGIVYTDYCSFEVPSTDPVLYLTVDNTQLQMGESFTARAYTTDQYDTIRIKIRGDTKISCDRDDTLCAVNYTTIKAGEYRVSAELTLNGRGYDATSIIVTTVPPVDPADFTVNMYPGDPTIGRDITIDVEVDHSEIIKQIEIYHDDLLIGLCKTRRCNAKTFVTSSPLNYRIVATDVTDSTFVHEKNLAVVSRVTAGSGSVALQNNTEMDNSSATVVEETNEEVPIQTITTKTDISVEEANEEQVTAAVRTSHTALIIVLAVLLLGIGGVAVSIYTMRK